jgi:hypothetical protein
MNLDLPNHGLLGCALGLVNTSHPVLKRPSTDFDPE